MKWTEIGFTLNVRAHDGSLVQVEFDSDPTDEQRHSGGARIVKDGRFVEHAHWQMEVESDENLTCIGYVLTLHCSKLPGCG